MSPRNANSKLSTRAELQEKLTETREGKTVVMASVFDLLHWTSQIP